MPGQRRFPICSLVLSVELVLGLFLLVADRPLPSTIAAAENAPGDAVVEHSEPVELSEEDKRRMLIVGEWEDDYQAGRHWELRDDGTGTMVVRLSGIPALLFASKLTFEQTWRVDGDEIVMAVTSGEPQGKVDIILKMEGDTSTQRIVEVTDERFVVIDHKGEQFDWRRVPDSETDSATE